MDLLKLLNFFFHLSLPLTTSNCINLFTESNLQSRLLYSHHFMHGEHSHTNTTNHLMFMPIATSISVILFIKAPFFDQSQNKSEYLRSKTDELAKGKLNCIYMSNVKVLLPKCTDFDSRYLTSAVQTDKILISVHWRLIQYNKSQHSGSIIWAL